MSSNKAFLANMQKIKSYKASKSLAAYSLERLFLKQNDYLVQCGKDLQVSDLYEYKALAKDCFERGELTYFIFKEVKRHFRVALLKNSIGTLNIELSNKDLSLGVVEAAIKLLKKAAKKGDFLYFNEEELAGVSSIVNRLYNAVSRSDALSQIKLPIAIKELVSKHLAKCIAHNDFLASQDIEISIKPLKETFSKRDLDFSAKYNKKVFDGKALKLTNNHIKELFVDEKMYGLDGRVVFELAYPEGHKDFEYLYDRKQPLLLEIKVSDKFNFLKKGSKSENHSREACFIAIANIEAGSHIKSKVATNIFSTEVKCEDVRSIELKFSDPLKALWSLHSPTYVDFKKSIDDLLTDNFYFDSLFKLDTSNCQSITERLPQVFVSCVGRNFYDFFIEQMVDNQCVIKYSSMGDTPTYYVADSIDSAFKKPFENSQDGVEKEFKRYDISSILTHELVQNSCDSYVKRTQLIPDISFKSSKKIDIKDSSGTTEFEKLAQTIVYPVNYLEIDPVKQNQAFTKQFCLNFETMVGVPFVNAEIDFTELKADDYLADSTVKSIYLTKRKLELTRSTYCSMYTRYGISHLYYKSDSDQDRYEKIAYTKKLALTHANKWSYTYGDYSVLSPDYPQYTPVKEFDMIGKVIIAKSVDEDSKKAYKFFKSYKMEESEFSSVQKDEEAGTYDVLNSKGAIFYAVELAPEMLAEDSSEDPIVYIPVRININSNVNEFMPLRNDDLIRLRVTGLIKCFGDELISNSAISTEKAQKKLLQRHLLGAKENCEVAYTQEEKDEIYSIVQQNKANDNSIFIHNNKGIFLTYKAKEN
ncbi:hypothetical protein [Francisella sp. Scap27]|uniref:hypothetical protein n=1 Tax=Francisella sp. Scap27 TaxID=2589986 RepID=UPI0015B92297|nr:hypothetical protein [Francisella sp. Scap27]